MGRPACPHTNPSQRRADESPGGWAGAGSRGVVQLESCAVRRGRRPAAVRQHKRQQRAVCQGDSSSGCWRGAVRSAGTTSRCKPPQSGAHMGTCYGMATIGLVHACMYQPEQVVSVLLARADGGLVMCLSVSVCVCLCPLLSASCCRALTRYQMTAGSCLSAGRRPTAAPRLRLWAPCSAAAAAVGHRHPQQAAWLLCRYRRGTTAAQAAVRTTPHSSRSRAGRSAARARWGR